MQLLGQAHPAGHSNHVLAMQTQDAVHVNQNASGHPHKGERRVRMYCMHASTRGLAYSQSLRTPRHQAPVRITHSTPGSTAVAGTCTPALMPTPSVYSNHTLTPPRLLDANAAATAAQGQVVLLTLMMRTVDTSAELAQVELSNSRPSHKVGKGPCKGDNMVLC